MLQILKILTCDGTKGCISSSGNREGGYTSPWNIAADFEIDLSFSPADIATMLADYETEHQIGMDISCIAKEIYRYTGGYPFLVSRVCQCMEEQMGQVFTIERVRSAVKIILAEKNILFDDIYKKINNYIELYDLLYDIVINEKFDMVLCTAKFAKHYKKWISVDL